MKQTTRCLLLLLLAAAASLPVRAAAQEAPVPPGSEGEVRPTAERQEEIQLERERWRRPVLRIGQDYVLAGDDGIREAVVILGDAVLDGRVERDVVVVFGQARLASTASIGGSLVVVGGSVTTAPGAIVGRDLVIVGGGLEGPADFAPGGQHIVIGPAALGGRLDAVIPWLTRGLLWGRLIVPGLGWMWTAVAFLFLIYLALNLVFHHPARACAATLAEKPLTAFSVGLLVLLLIGPICLLLMVSVIGIAVVPFVLCAVFIAGVIGKVGVTRWVGMSVMPQESLDARLQSLRSFVIGFAVITLAYMVPVLGVVTWTMVGVFGLGAATLAFMTAYRRENPRPAPRLSWRARRQAAAGAAAAVALPRSEAPARPMAAPLPIVDPAVPISESPSPFVDQPPPRAEPFAGATGIPFGGATGIPFAGDGPGIGADLLSFEHAAFLVRLAAFVLDVILVVIAYQVINSNNHDEEGLLFLMLLAYHVGFWTWKGTTVGGIICQLRVIRVDGAPLRFIDALVRGLSSIFSLAVVGIGCLWILKDPDRQAWHDRIAGTFVVRVPRNWPI